MRRIPFALTRRSTYRHWAYLIVGGAMLVPYLLFGAVIVPSLVPVLDRVYPAVVVGGMAAVVVLVGTAFIPAVRSLEVASARELLALGESTWDNRQRGSAAALFLVHVVVGGLLSAISLVLLAMAALAMVSPFTGEFGVGTNGGIPVPRGWASAWVPAVALVAVVLMFYLIDGAGHVLSTFAARLLRPTASMRLARLEEHTRRLAARNQLARELHDSVGHALSVITIQAGATRRSLPADSDTQQALAVIEDSARTALEDLDHVLGLLREDASGRTPQAGLADLPALLAATKSAGVSVETRVDGDLDQLTPVVSREAYRIVQECLTNVLQHAGAVPALVLLRVADDKLELTVRNPLGERPSLTRTGGGRGLRGIAERVMLLRGDFQADRRSNEWEVKVRIPNRTREP